MMGFSHGARLLFDPDGGVKGACRCVPGACCLAGIKTGAIIGQAVGERISGADVFAWLVSRPMASRASAAMVPPEPTKEALDVPVFQVPTACSVFAR